MEGKRGINIEPPRSQLTSLYFGVGAAAVAQRQQTGGKMVAEAPAEERRGDCRGAGRTYYSIVLDGLLKELLPFSLLLL